ncbi:MAG: hypothetical protein AABX82_02100 [Nanoarchaeota archaeon]
MAKDRRTIHWYNYFDESNAAEIIRTLLGGEEWILLPEWKGQPVGAYEKQFNPFSLDPLSEGSPRDSGSLFDFCGCDVLNVLYHRTGGSAYWHGIAEILADMKPARESPLGIYGRGELIVALGNITPPMKNTGTVPTLLKREIEWHRFEYFDLWEEKHGKSPQKHDALVHLLEAYAMVQQGEDSRYWKHKIEQYNSPIHQAMAFRGLAYCDSQEAVAMLDTLPPSIERPLAEMHIRSAQRIEKKVN